jgi:hypothetical protein
MAKLKSKSEAKLEHSQSWPRIPVHGNIQRAWSISSHDGNTRNRGGIYYRINLCLSAIALLSCAILPQTARANGNVGGVSATANPVATSSGSVTNQAIQMLTGPYPTSQFGNGISCQGPVLNVSPYGGASKSWTLPFEPYFDTPVYSTIDSDEDGYIDDPSEILYNVPTRTGQKDNYNINLGVSATISFPLDGSIQRRCKEAADANIAMMKQLTANKRLDFELARLKNCADQKLRGVSFHPKSPYYSVCADVVVQIPPGGLPQHRHTIPTSAETSAPPDAEKG